LRWKDAWGDAKTERKAPDSLAPDVDEGFAERFREEWIPPAGIEGALEKARRWSPSLCASDSMPQ